MSHILVQSASCVPPCPVEVVRIAQHSTAARVQPLTMRLVHEALLRLVLDWHYELRRRKPAHIRVPATA